LVRQVFIGQIGFSQLGRVLVSSGWQMQFVFIGEGFVTFHSDFLAQFCSFINLFFTLAVTRLTRRFGWVRIFFGDCESSCNRYNIFKMGLVFTFEQKDRRSVSAPNTACTRLVGVCAPLGSLRGLELFR
jgi:hypothetical protein